MAEEKSESTQASESQADETTLARVQHLRDVVRYHQQRYYIDDAPEISDQEFDALFGELQSLEEAYPDLRSDDSPTMRVGGVVADRFEKTRHPAPMLSLANAFDDETLYAWRDRLKRLLPEDEEARLAYVVEPKFDGLTVVLHYVERSLHAGRNAWRRRIWRGDHQQPADRSSVALTDPCDAQRRPFGSISIGCAWRSLCGQGCFRDVQSAPGRGRRADLRQPTQLRRRQSAPTGQRRDGPAPHQDLGLPDSQFWKA